MPWIGPAISGGASLIGGAMGMFGQSQTNANQMAMMQQNEQWQEQMSDTAMQRRVTDLKAAGLNPLLAVSSGGATTGSTGIPQLGNPMGQLGAGVANAGQAATQVLQQQNLKAQTAATNASAANTDADTYNKQGIGALGQVQVENILSDTGLKNATIANLRQQVQESIARTGLTTTQAHLALVNIDNATEQGRGISAQSSMAELDLATQQKLFSGLVSAANAGFAQSQSSASAMNAFNNSVLGKIYYAIGGHAGAAGAISSAASVASRFLK